MLKYASDIIECVKNASRKLARSPNPPPRPITLVLLGGAAVMLGHKGKRWTMDIDAIHTEGLHGLGDVMEELHVVTDAIAYLHPDYMERVIPVSSFGNIDLFTLSPVDIAISKTARGYPKDFKDIYDSTLTDSLNLKEFDSLYTEAMDYWIGGRREVFLHNMEETKTIIREKHLQNDTGILDIINEKLDLICVSGDIGGAMEPEAVKYIIRDLDERSRLKTSPGVRRSAEYLLQYGGEALTDTRGEIMMINLLKRHYERTNPVSRQTHADAAEGVNPAKLFKLFKTLSQLVVSRINENKLEELEDCYHSPAP